MSTPRKLRCVLGQLNLVVGDVEGNTSQIVADLESGPATS